MRVARVIAPVVHDQQDLGAENAGQNDQCAQIPHLLGIQTLLAGDFENHHQADDDPDGNQQAVSGQTKSVKIKETGIHVGCS